MSKHHDKKTEKPSDGAENVAKDCTAKDFASEVQGGVNVFCEKENCAKPEAQKPDVYQGEKAESILEKGAKTDTEDCTTKSDLKLEELEAKYKELEDRYLRKAADFDNYRKRMIREKQEAIDYANGNLLLDLVQIIDDFDRAIEAAEKHAGEAAKAFMDGFTMIKKQMVSMLQNKYGLAYYPAAGEPFDPNIHEAVVMHESPDVTTAIIGEELQKGYKLKDRIIRHAKVSVLVPVTKREEKQAEKSESADKKTE